MSRFEPSDFNPEIIRSLKSQLGYSTEDVARHTKIELSRLAEIESGAVTPASRELKTLATFFRVEEFNFYQRIAPSKNRRISFRARMQDYRGEPGPLLDAINFASEIQRLLLSVTDTGSLWQRRNDRQLTPSSDPEVEAAWWRENIGLSDESQLNAKSHDSFFLLFRSLIEGQGISVIVSSYEEARFKGLVIGSNSDVPVILINSFRQLKSSRTFTLAHEFGHVLLGDDGVSNPYEAASKVERICNRFAAALLMPREVVSRLLNDRASATTNATIKWLSNKLKVSMEAVVIRLIECGFAERNFWKTWRAQFGRWLPSEEKVRGGGASETGVDQGWVKLAKFGFLFGRLVPERFREKGLTGMAIFNASRLKPAYLPELARATKERLAEVEAYGRP